MRVISNIATGETGIILAKRLKDLGAKVTLLLGPTESCCLNKKIKLIRFQFFEELKHLMLKELSNKEYDMVIHSAAVADYQPLKVYPEKIKSDQELLNLTLVPTVKIIDLIKRLKPSLFLVGFKFEFQAYKEGLIQKTKALIRRAHLDLAVANTINKNRYQGYIVNQNKTYGPFENRKDLVEKLIQVIIRR